MDELMQKKAELMLDVEMLPDVIDDVPHKGFRKLTNTEMAAGKLVFSSIIKHVQSPSPAGLYKVTIPNGIGELGKLKDGTGYFGGVVGGDGKFISQARLNPVQKVPVNPTMMFMAVAVASISMKLEQIQETQREILEFLEKREKSKILGSAKILDEISKELKFHWDNEKYRDAKYILVQDIKKEAAQNIIFYKDLANKVAETDSLVHLETDLDDQLNDFSDNYRFYKLSMEMYARASLLEVLLLEDFDSNHLKGIVDRLQEMSEQQVLFYDNCRNSLEKYARSTAESFFTGVGSGVVKGVGTFLSWIPGVNETGADKALKSTGDDMDKSIDKKVERKFAKIDEFKAGAMGEYIENIKSIDMMYTKPMTLLFDDENVYVGIEEEVA